MELRNLRYRYPGKGFSLGPLDVSGPDDRPWLLLGPSGSGKSTLLRLLGGVLDPDEGEIRTSLQPSLCAYLPQFPERTFAGRSIAEDLTGRREPEPSARERLERVLAQVGLHHVSLQGRSASLSAGERRSLALCLVLLGRFRGWALDEPDAALDRASVDRLVALLMDLQRKDEMRMWLATRRFERFVSLDPWILVLDGGRCEASGNLAEVIRSSKVRDLLDIPGRAEGRLWKELAHRAPSRFPGSVLDPPDEGPAGRIRGELARRLGFS